MTEAHTTTSPGSLSGSYTADPIHSNIGFAVKYMGVSTFRSNFSDVEATLTDESGELVLEGRAAVESVAITSPPEFRAHVLSEEFFDAERHPHLEFRSTRIELSDDATATLEGELTIKGRSVPVSARGTWQGDTAHAFGGERAALQLETVVSRDEFDLRWNAPLPGGGRALEDEVTITVDLNFVKES